MISLDDVLALHEWLIDQTGGSKGLRNEGLLKSALKRPSASFDGTDLYLTLEEKIAALCHSLIQNHSFVDGNKRVGVTVLLTLARMHNIELCYTQDELVSLGLNVANGTWDEKRILSWLQAHKIKNNC